MLPCGTFCKRLCRSLGLRCRTPRPYACCTALSSGRPPSSQTITYESERLEKSNLCTKAAAWRETNILQVHSAASQRGLPGRQRGERPGGGGRTVGAGAQGPGRGQAAGGRVPDVCTEAEKHHGEFWLLARLCICIYTHKRLSAPQDIPLSKVLEAQVAMPPTSVPKSAL